jgi:hypothetical protein
VLEGVHRAAAGVADPAKPGHRRAHVVGGLRAEEADDAEVAAQRRAVPVGLAGPATEQVPLGGQVEVGLAEQVLLALVLLLGGGQRPAASL